MDKLTIKYGALSKRATLELHKAGKFIVFRKYLDHTSIEDLISLAVEVFEKYNDN